MPSIAPDPVIVIAQILLFVVVWMLLSRLWLRPALRIIRERSSRSEGALREAQAIRAEAERLRAAQTAALEAARAEAQQEMQEILRGAEAEQKRLIAEARSEAERTLTDVRGRIAEEVVAARESLHNDAEAIAREVARKVLGRAV